MTANLVDLVKEKEMDWSLVKEGLEIIAKGMETVDAGIPDNCENSDFTQLYWELSQRWGYLMNITYREGKFTNPDSYP